MKIEFELPKLCRWHKGGLATVGWMWVASWFYSAMAPAREDWWAFPLVITLFAVGIGLLYYTMWVGYEGDNK